MIVHKICRYFRDDGSDFGVFRGKARVSIFLVEGLADRDGSSSERLVGFDAFTGVDRHFSSHLLHLGLFSSDHVFQSHELSFVESDLSLNVLILSGGLSHHAAFMRSSSNLRSKSSLLSLLRLRVRLLHVSWRSSHLNLRLSTVGLLLIGWVSRLIHRVTVGLNNMRLLHLHVLGSHLLSHGSASSSFGSTEFAEDAGEHTSSDEHSPLEHMVISSSFLSSFLLFFFSQITVKFFIWIIKRTTSHLVLALGVFTSVRSSVAISVRSIFRNDGINDRFLLDFNYFFNFFSRERLINRLLSDGPDDYGLLRESCDEEGQSE